MRSRELRLTLVNFGGPDASAAYSEDTGLRIWSTETFQSDGPAAAAEAFTCTYLPVFRLSFLPWARAETEPGPGWSDEEERRGLSGKMSGSSGTSKWSFSEG